MKAKLEIDGIEFRIGNEKGAVSVVPPSIHPEGHRYKWLKRLSLDDVEPAELPEDVAKRLRETRRKVTTPSDGDLPEGKRNNELFQIACKLARAGLAANSLNAALLAENAARCKPPLSESEVASIATSASSRSEQGPKTSAGILMEIALSESELWHTPDDVGYATIQRNGHREHWPLRSKGFRQWLAKQFYEHQGRAVSLQTLQNVINTLEGQANFDAPVYPTFVRVGHFGDRIYIDSADDTWGAIEIDTNGWRNIDAPPVRFRRPSRMLPLLVPLPGGSVGELRKFVNVTNDQWPLLLAWLVAALRPSGPYTILKIVGEQGSAKTTQTRVLRALVDPNTCPTRAAPKTERDLMIAAHNGWICAFDNLSYVTPELSDALCRLSTGGGFGVRTHYENDEETVFRAYRPIILNGIEDIGTRSDLMDRAIILELPRIKDSERRSEKEFDREFAAAGPRILGALLDAVVAALRNLPTVEQSATVWPRMADFAHWAVAAEKALGLEAGAFLRAYAANRETANQTALESSTVVTALMAMLRSRGTFEGTATQLLGLLIIGQDTRAQGWPKNPRALSGMLNRLAPNLRQAGLTIEQRKRGIDKLWFIARKQTVPQKPQNPQKNAVGPSKCSEIVEHLRKKLTGG
jgi:hypothetical protein